MIPADPTRTPPVDYNKMLVRYPRTFLWTRYRYYWPVTLFWATTARVLLQSIYGRFSLVTPASHKVPNTIGEVEGNRKDKVVNDQRQDDQVVQDESGSKPVADGDYMNGGTIGSQAVTPHD